jgi:CRP-like cAMP-binding protein
MMRTPSPPKNAAGPQGPIELGRLEIFKAVSDATLARIGRQAQKRNLGKGEVLFSAGDPSEALYVVGEGRVRIWIVSADGAEVTLNVLTGGSVFGEIGMLDGGTRTAGASAMTPAQLLSIGRRSFFDALDGDPQLARNVVELLCKRLRWTSARMEDAALRQAPQRLARIIGHLARDYGNETSDGTEILLKLTQGELAQWTAMSREGLNKLLNRWIGERVISQRSGILVVHDLAQIDDIAEFGE